MQAKPVRNRLLRHATPVEVPDTLGLLVGQLGTGMSFATLVVVTDVATLAQ